MYSLEIKWRRIPSKEFDRHSLPLIIKLSDEQVVSEAHIGSTQDLRRRSL